jgi:hypothetical protein
MTAGWTRVVEMREAHGDLEPGVRTALGRLGYRLISPDESKRYPPALRLMNPRALPRIPNDPTPMILIGAAADTAREDARVAGVLQRPADLTRLYRVLQNALEDRPRECPRAATRLPARCVEDDRDWPGAILELSAKGCLLHSSAAPSPEGTRITFALPERGLVEATAEMRSRRDGDAGLFFREISESHRSAIAEYVNQVLMS